MVNSRAGKRCRLDARLLRAGDVLSSDEAQRLVMAGLVTVNGATATSAALMVRDTDAVEVRRPAQFVGRGAQKLSHALDSFRVSPAGVECLDVGASTGGFTDLLLQRGAKRVVAVDVGYGEFAWKLRTDPRVVLYERTNIRNVTELPAMPELVVIDVSFISLATVLPTVDRLRAESASVIALIKPQFEAERSDVPEGGVIRDPVLHERILVTLLRGRQPGSLALQGLCSSPIRGAEGNREFFGLWRGVAGALEFDIESAIRSVVSDESAVVLATT